jgi:hypothetical protein
MHTRILLLLFLSLFVFAFPTFAHEDEVATPTSIQEHIQAATDNPHPTATPEAVNAVKNQLWTYVAIAAGGIAVGSLGTFILLTVTLHPKK